MNRKRTAVCSCIILLLLTGCEKQTSMLPSASATDQPQDMKSQETVMAETETQQTETVEKQYDLTTMNKDMVYATVYQMMSEPDHFEGKAIRLKGVFYTYQDKKTNKKYYYCLVKDALACCSQGIEFVCRNKKYPKEDAEIQVEGTFHTYREKGDDNLYCHLTDAQWKGYKE